MFLYAIVKGVSYALLEISKSAPASTSIFTVSKSPLLQAKCNAESINPGKALL